MFNVFQWYPAISIGKIFKVIRFGRIWIRCVISSNSFKVLECFHVSSSIIIGRLLFRIEDNYFRKSDCLSAAELTALWAESLWQTATVSLSSNSLSYKLKIVYRHIFIIKSILWFHGIMCQRSHPPKIVSKYWNVFMSLICAN